MLPGIFHPDVFHEDVFRTGPLGRAYDPDDDKEQKKRLRSHLKQLKYEDTEIEEFMIMLVTSGILEE
jgi:hypothetical protein